jgi:hypothetical protein
MRPQTVAAQAGMKLLPESHSVVGAREELLAFA